MTAVATDTQQLLYQWHYGDGTESGWLSSPTVDKAYSEDGIYTAYLAVMEDSGTDAFITWRRATVTVTGFNTAPHNVTIRYYPTNPNTGTIVSLYGSAEDDEGDPLTFRWDFGDGRTGGGQNVTHRFAEPRSYYMVTLSVDDGHLGSSPRPVNASKAIGVSENYPPWCEVPDFNVVKGVPKLFIVKSSDPNPYDSLRYTFDWGDGSAVNVSSSPAATHTYSRQSVFILTGWVDDLTGLPGHNVSDTGSINFYSTLHPPVVESLVVSDLTPAKGQTVKVTAVVTDLDGDLCGLTFDFGDHTSAVAYQYWPNHEVVVSHVYMTTGQLAINVTATDGFLSDTNDVPLVVDVQPTFDVALVPGWNIVSAPTVGFSYKASSLLGLETGDIVVGWNSTRQSYDQVYVIGVSYPFKDFKIAEGTGYWIYSYGSGSKTLYLEGSDPNGTQTRSVTVPAAGGWFMFGLASLRTTYKASDVPTWYTGGNVLVVAAFQPPYGPYIVWTPISAPFKDFFLVPGQAYWVFVSASGTLSYTA